MVAAQQTVHSGIVSPAPRSRAAPLPAPACVFWCLVFLCWRSCDCGRRRKGGERGGPRTPTRALAIDIDAGRSAPPPLLHGRPSQHSAPPSLRATGINTNNGVRGRGWGSSAGGHHRGALTARAQL